MIALLSNMPCSGYARYTITYDYNMHLQVFEHKVKKHVC